MAENRNPIIDRRVAAGIISLADFCYRSGVRDALMLGDEGAAREFLERTAAPGVFGFLNEEGRLMRWQEFTLRLMSRARMECWNSPMNRYFALMGRYGQNYLSVFIPVAQLYICRGVRDAVRYGAAVPLARFDVKKRSVMTDRGLRRMSCRQYVEEIQMMAFDLERRDAEIREWHTAGEARGMGVLKPKHYEMFRRAIGLALLPRG